MSSDIHLVVTFAASSVLHDLPASNRGRYTRVTLNFEGMLIDGQGVEVAVVTECPAIKSSIVGVWPYPLSYTAAAAATPCIAARWRSYMV